MDEHAWFPPTPYNNKYVYYSSLGDNRSYQARKLGYEASDRLQTGIRQLTNSDLKGESEVGGAINLLQTAANNERTKEKAWLSKLCEALNMDKPVDENNYLDVILLLNKAYQGNEKTINTIYSELKRYQNIDISTEIAQKTKQNNKEIQAEIARAQGDTEKADRLHQEAGEAYYNEGVEGQKLSKNLQTKAQLIGKISKEAGKLLTGGSSRGFTAEIEKRLLPLVMKELRISNNNKIEINLSALNEITEEILIWVIEQVTEADLKKLREEDKNSNKKHSYQDTFLKQKAKQRKKKIDDIIDGKDKSTISPQQLENKIKSVIAEKHAIAQISESFVAPSNDTKRNLSTYSENDVKMANICRHLLDSLAEDEYYKKAYVKAMKEQKSRFRSTAKDNKHYRQWLEQTYRVKESITESSIKLALQNSVKQAFEYSEQTGVNDFVKLSLNGEVVAKGGSFRPRGNPKEDVYAGFLTYKLTYNDAPLQEELGNVKKAQDVLKHAAEQSADLYKKAYGTKKEKPAAVRRIQASASNKSYEENAETMRQIRDQQAKILQDAAKEAEQQNAQLQEVLTQFNVLTSVKDQNGILTRAFDGIYERGIGFQGGAMGENSDYSSVVDNIIMLAKAGNISGYAADAEWLKFAILNSGIGLVGERKKATLENYITLFAAYLMFSDAKNIVVDAVNQTAEQIGKEITSNEIHLYLVNGIYLPQSYILQTLHDRMQEILQSGMMNQRNLYDGTVRVEITSYNPGDFYPGNTQTDWERESQKAQDTTKIKMYYLMNFGSLIQDLAKKMEI